MNHTLEIILLVISALCFLTASVGITSKINLVAFGLFLWVLTVLIPQIK